MLKLTGEKIFTFYAKPLLSVLMSLLYVTVNNISVTTISLVEHVLGKKDEGSCTVTQKISFFRIVNYDLLVTFKTQLSHNR